MIRIKEKGGVALSVADIARTIPELARGRNVVFTGASENQARPPEGAR